MQAVVVEVTKAALVVVRAELVVVERQDQPLAVQELLEQLTLEVVVAG
jgi:hypothetical protein